jgi:hypothetical protein
MELKRAGSAIATLSGDAAVRCCRIGRRFLALLSATLILGCATDRLHIPRPNEPLIPPPATPSLGPSAVDLPVAIALDRLAMAVAEGIPAEKAEERNWIDLPGQPGAQYQFRLWRGKPELRMDGERLEVSFPEMRYRVRARLVSPNGTLEGSCGYADEPHRVRIDASIRFDWAEDGTIRSHTSFSPVQFETPCQLAPLSLDVTPMLASTLDAALPALGRKLDDAARARSLSQHRLAGLWQQLQEPTELEKGLWLAWSPADLTVAPYAAAGQDNIGTSLSFALQPQVTTGAKPDPGTLPLPPVRVEPAKDGGSHLAVPITVGYDFIDRALSKRMVGTEFDAGPLGPVKVVSVHMYGSGNQAILQAGVAGGIEGFIYAIGKPVYDPAERTLSIDGLDLTLDTKNVLANAANALAHDQIVAQLASSTRIDLTERIRKFRDNLQRNFNRELASGIRMQGTDVDFAPTGVYPVAGGLQIQVVVDAKLRLTVQ